MQIKNKKILFILTIAGALLFAGTVLGLGGYFYKINPGANEVPHDTFTRGLVGYWDFDEGAGQTATDLSGNQNHGTLGSSSGADVNDPSWVSGGSASKGGDRTSYSGGALSFDGTDDYVDANNDASVQNIFTNGGTLCAWINPNSDGEDNYGRVLNKSDGIGPNTGWVWFLRDESAGKTKLQFRHGFNTTAGVWTTTNLDISLNTWNFIVVTYNKDNVSNDAVFYINGQSVSTLNDTTSVGTAVSDSANNLFIGNNSALASKTFDGQIDQVRVYNRALSAQEIRYHYNRGGPVASWDFDEGSGSIAYDLTGNGNDGVLNNMDNSDWVEGKDGTALDFDGSDDYVGISNFNLTFPATIIMWVKPSSGAFLNHGAFLSRDGSTTFLWYYSIASSRISIYDGSGNSGTIGLLQENEWQQIAMTFDESGNGHHWYNGIQDLAFSTVNEPTNPFELRIGEWSFYDFNGQIDQVRIYDYARTADEILLDYNKGKAAHFGLATTDCDSDPASCMDYGLVGNWGMDEGAGQTATDLSGNQNHGTLENGPTWASDSPEEGGGSLSFDGTDDYVDCGNDGSIRFSSNNFSIAAWVKMPTSTAHRTIAGVGRHNVDEWFFYYNHSSPIYSYSFYGGNGNINLSATTDPRDNVWHHVVFVRNGSNGYIYFNGIEENSQSGITCNLSSSKALLIGKNETLGEHFNGKIDQVRVYNRALSAEEVRYHYNRGGPVASWDFDEGSGSIAYDSTGNDNDGTWNGTGTHWAAGKFGTAGQFADASSDYVSIANNISNAKTISFWTNLDTTTEDIISGDGTGITVDSGAMSYGAWDNCFVDGVDTDIITTGWRHVVLTSTSDVSLTAIKLGYTNGGLDGKLDDVKIYQYERSAPEILLDFNKGKAAHFGLATTDCDSDPASCMDYGLVGNWGMDEGAGTTTQDYSGNNNHGTLENGPTWTKGQSSGGGLSFDGADDYVKIDYDSSLYCSPNMTVSFWEKSDITDYTSNAYVVSMWDTNADRMWSIRITAASDEWAVSASNNGVSNTNKDTTTSVDTNWHLISFVVNNTAKEWKFYLDGVFQETLTHTYTYTDQNSFLTIGGLDGSNFFDGQIDQVRVYNRALGAEEVRYYYNRGGPVAEWKMNERTGAKIYDSTSNNNDGKLNFGAAGTNTSYEDMWQGASDNLGIEFDGTDDYVNCGNNASLDITDAITLETWINRGSGGDIFQRIVDKNTAAYTFYITKANNRLSCYIVWADSTTTDIYTNGPIISIGVWTHVVLTYSKADGKITFYKNAVASEYSGYGKSIKSVGDSVYIGDRADTGRSYHGQIDQVRIYNRALSASEILERYWEGKMAHP